MMEILYYPYWNIAFIPGIIIFSTTTILLIISLADTRKENSSMRFVKEFYLYFQNTDGWIIFGKIIVVLVIHIILCPLTILILFYFSPNFILIIFQLSTITNSLIEKPKKALSCIILYILQFLALMIHLEILELNFCRLNKFTKRNIELRGLEDIIGEGRDTTADLNNIDVNKDYYLTEMEDRTMNVTEIQ